VSASTNSPHEGVKSPIRITLGLSREGSQVGLAPEPHQNRLTLKIRRQSKDIVRKSVIGDLIGDLNGNSEGNYYNKRIVGECVRNNRSEGKATLYKSLLYLSVNRPLRARDLTANAQIHIRTRLLSPVTYVSPTSLEIQ
jgi:hypothetical protein